MPVMNLFPGGSTVQIPLDAPTALTATAGNAQVSLTWTDPKDKYATPEGEIAQDPDQLVSKWAYTRIVRKVGSQPTGPNDGTTVLESAVRNQYQTEPFVDTGLQNEVTYYYGAFAYNEDGVVSEGAFASATPKAYDPILNNNSWETIEDIGAQGLAPSIWEIGDEKDFTVNSKTLTAVIIGFNRTSLVSGGTAPITFGTKNLMASKKVVKYGWWNETAMGKYVIDTLPTQMEEDLQAVLKTVTAYCGYKSYASYTNPDDYVTESRAYQTKAFGFTSKEVFGSKGPGYAQYPYFATQSNRVKKLNNGAGAASEWALTESIRQRLQVGGDTTLYYYCFMVTRDGVERRDFNTDESSGTSLGVCFGFCV